MPKFKKEKKVIRKQVGGGFDVFQAAQDIAERIPTGAIKAALMQVPSQTTGAARMASNIARYLPPTVAGELLGQGALGLATGMLGSPGRERASAMGAGLSQRLPKVPSGIAVPGQQVEDIEVEPQAKPSAPSGGRKQPAASRQPAISRTNQGRAASMADLGLAALGGVPSGISGMLPGATSATAPSRNAMYDYDTASSPASLKEMSAIFKQAAKAPGAPADMAKAAGEIPKTKAGLKKFMQEYGKFIALGAMAGQGGKGGQIAAPIMAALPGLIEMMKSKKKSAGSPAVKNNEGGFMKNGTKRFANGGKSGVEFLSPNEIARRRMIMKDPSGVSISELRSLGLEPSASDDERFMRESLSKMVRDRSTLPPSLAGMGKRPSGKSGVVDVAVPRVHDYAEELIQYMKKKPISASSSGASSRGYDGIVDYMKKSQSSVAKPSRPKADVSSPKRSSLARKPKQFTAPARIGRDYEPQQIDADLSFLESFSDRDDELMRKVPLGVPSLPSAPEPVEARESEGESSELESLSLYKPSQGQKKSKFKRFLSGIGSLVKGKSSGGEPLKKSEGGAIRKFKGGSMKGNTKDSMLTPKYKKGGATGEMPQHKKMAMGKPTPQSMKQKFAKGGTMKCASGGVPKGYGISKKIRPTGPMN